MAEEETVGQVKDTVSLALLNEFAKEIARRSEAGTLNEDLGKMKLGTLLTHVKALLAALKTPTASLNINLPIVPDQEKIRLGSAMRQTPHQRKIIHTQAMKQLKNGDGKK